MPWVGAPAGVGRAWACKRAAAGPQVLQSSPEALLTWAFCLASKLRELGPLKQYSHEVTGLSEWTILGLSE